MDFRKLQQEIVHIVDSLDERAVPMKPYAQTYARHIVAAAAEAGSYGDTPMKACKTQLLYVVSNLEGAPEIALRRIQRTAARYGIDIARVVDEVLHGYEEDGPGENPPRRRRARGVGQSEYERGFSQARRAVIERGFVPAAQQAHVVNDRETPEFARGFYAGLHHEEAHHHAAGIIPELDLPGLGYSTVGHGGYAEDHLRARVLDAIDDVFTGMLEGKDLDPMDLLVLQGLGQATCQQTDARSGRKIGDMYWGPLQMFLADPRSLSPADVGLLSEVMHEAALTIPSEGLAHILRYAAEGVQAYRSLEPAQINPPPGNTRRANPGQFTVGERVKVVTRVEPACDATVLAVLAEHDSVYIQLDSDGSELWVKLNKIRHRRPGERSCPDCAKSKR